MKRNKILSAFAIPLLLGMFCSSIQKSSANTTIEFSMDKIVRKEVPFNIPLATLPEQDIIPLGEIPILVIRVLQAVDQFLNIALTQRQGNLPL